MVCKRFLRKKKRSMKLLKLLREVGIPSYLEQEYTNIKSTKLETV